MQELITFFFRYLLAPLIVIVLSFFMRYLSKGRSTLNSKKLVVFILIMSLIVAFPSLLGLLKYEFIWGGLLISIFIYLLLGILFTWFTASPIFEKIGFKKENIWLTLIGCLIFMVIGGWIYFLAFSYLSKLSYGIYATLGMLWFLVPMLYKVSKDRFIEIPKLFYDYWVIKNDPADNEYWNNIDTFRLKQVVVKVKRNFKAKHYASFSVKIPDDVELGKWFDRFIADQDRRFPQNAIELLDKSTEKKFGWIFYTPKWFHFTLFTRNLDFNTTVAKNKIRNKDIIFIKRVSQSTVSNTLKIEKTEKNENPVNHEQKISGNKLD